MLGWEIFIYSDLANQRPSGSEGLLVADWLSDLDGICWIKAMVDDGLATSLGGNGYPSAFNVPATYLLPRLYAGLDRDAISYDDQYALPPKCNNYTINAGNIFLCSLTDSFTVEAWDQS